MKRKRGPERFPQTRMAKGTGVHPQLPGQLSCIDNVPRRCIVRVGGVKGYVFLPAGMTFRTGDAVHNIVFAKFKFIVGSRKHLGISGVALQAVGPDLPVEKENIGKTRAVAPGAGGAVIRNRQLKQLVISPIQIRLPVLAGTYHNIKPGSVCFRSVDACRLTVVVSVFQHHHFHKWIVLKHVPPFFKTSFY